MFIPPIYPITDTRISGLSHVEQVRQLIEGGATIIQLREKYATPREFYTQAAECLAYARIRGVKIIINDRVDIALMSGADGVHVGQDDIPPQAARKVLGAEKIIGHSTHSVDQAIAAARLGVDYVAIGPIFSTKTKVNADPVVGFVDLAAIRSAISPTPLVAIGGIDMMNIADVLGAGADSTAVIRGILDSPGGIVSAMKCLMTAAQR